MTKRLCGFSLCLMLFISTGSAQEISLRGAGLYATDTLSVYLASVPQNKVTVQSAASLSGVLTVRAADQTNLVVSYVKQARTSDRSRAFDYIDQISVNLTETGGGARIVLRAPNPAPWGEGPESGMVEALITVPLDCFVKIEAVAFDIDVIGPLSGLVIPRSLGRLKATGISGLLDVKTGQKVTLEDITGSISVVTSNSTLFAKSIDAGEEMAFFKNEEGDIKIVGFTGGLKVRNSRGRIDIMNFVPTGATNSISGSSAPITVDILDMWQGQLVISNRNEDIEISVPDTLSAFYFLSVGDEGEIDTSNLPVRTEMVRKGRLNLVSGKGGVDIKGTVKGEGNIYLRGFEVDR